MVGARSSSVVNLKIIQYIAFTIAIIATLLLISNDDCSATGKPCFTLVQSTLSGFLVGGIYALVALGIVVINKASGVFNFAHGYMMLAGALLFWQAFAGIPSQELSLMLALVAGSIVPGLVGIRPETREAIAGKPTLERWSKQFNDTRYLSGIGIGIMVGAIAYFMFRNLAHDKLPDFLQDTVTVMQVDILRGILASIVGSTALGLIVERFAIRPLLGQPMLAAIMMTLAVALIVQGTSALIWGTQPKDLSIFSEPPLITLIPTGVDAATGQISYIENKVSGKALPNYKLSTKDWLGQDLSFARNLVWGFGIAITCFIGFVIFFQFTGVGLAMRAVAENQTLAESVGLRVRTILAVAWAIAATMAMIAGVIQGTGPGVGVSVLVIPSLAFRAFPAVLLGGLESITGALVGGLLIGVVEVLTSAYVDSSAAQEFAPFAVLLIVLMIRPDGLFGQRRIDRV